MSPPNRAGRPVPCATTSPSRRNCFPSRSASSSIAWSSASPPDRAAGRRARPCATSSREILPLDADRRAETAIWLAFASRSVADRRIAEELELVFVGTRDLCRRIAHDLDRYGNLAPGHDPDLEAARLHALIDGLTLQSTLGHLDPEAIDSLLDAHLAEMIP